MRAWPQDFSGIIQCAGYQAYDSFARSNESGRKITLTGNCHREGVDVYAYLKDLFTRLPTVTNQRVKDLPPEACAKQQHENQISVQPFALTTKPGTVL